MLEIKPNDVVDFVADQDWMKAEALAFRINDIAAKQRSRDLLHSVKEVTTDTQIFPMVTLEVRMQEMIRGMIHHLMLDENEVKQLAQISFDKAIANLDISKMIADQIKISVGSCVRDQTERAFRYLFNEPLVQAAMRKRLIKMLEEKSEL